MPKLALTAFLPYRLVSVADQVSRLISCIYTEQFNLTRPEWRILASLEELGSTSATDICAHSTQDKMTVSRAVSGLEAKGFLRRHDNPQDRRNKQLELTPAGHALYQQIVPLILEREACLLTNFSADEQATLMQLLGKLQDRSAALTQPSKP